MKTEIKIRRDSAVNWPVTHLYEANSFCKRVSENLEQFLVKQLGIELTNSENTRSYMRKGGKRLADGLKTRLGGIPGLLPGGGHENHENHVTEIPGLNGKVLSIPGKIINTTFFCLSQIHQDAGTGIQVGSSYRSKDDSALILSLSPSSLQSPQPLPGLDLPRFFCPLDI